jgi:hypothetical protein
MSRAHPQATVDRMRRLRAVHSLSAIARIVGCSVSAVRTAELRGWREGQPGMGRRTRPDDFAIQADHMTITQLQLHYRTSQKRIYEWLATVDRQYKPKLAHIVQKPMPDRETIEARIAELGVTGALRSFGVTQVTFQRWRERLGLPVKYKRKRKLPQREIGWAERRFSSPGAQRPIFDEGNRPCPMDR